MRTAKANVRFPRLSCHSRLALAPPKAAMAALSQFQAESGLSGHDDVADTLPFHQNPHMSYDLMVFDPDVAPRVPDDFERWYLKQTEWSEGHSYNDPKTSTEALANWYADISTLFPPMNGPFASLDLDNPKVSDYSIGKSVIYVAFAWSQARDAYDTVTHLAAKHGIGFFDVSCDLGEIRFP